MNPWQRPTSRWRKPPAPRGVELCRCQTSVGSHPLTQTLVDTSSGRKPRSSSRAYPCCWVDRQAAEVRGLAPGTPASRRGAGRRSTRPVRRRLAEHPAEVDVMFLGAGRLGGRHAAPIGRERAWCQGRLGRHAGGQPDIPRRRRPAEAAREWNCDHRAQRASVEAVALDDDDGSSKARFGADGFAEVGPPHVALRDHHSVDSSVCRLAAVTNGSVPSPTSVTTRSS